MQNYEEGRKLGLTDEQLYGIGNVTNDFLQKVRNEIAPATTVTPVTAQMVNRLAMTEYIDQNKKDQDPYICDTDYQK